MSTFFSRFLRVGENSSCSATKTEFSELIKDVQCEICVRWKQEPRLGSWGVLWYLWCAVGSRLTQGHEHFEQGARGRLAVPTDSPAQLSHTLLDVAAQGFLHDLVHLLGVALKAIVDLKMIKRKYGARVQLCYPVNVDDHCLSVYN